MYFVLCNSGERFIILSSFSNTGESLGTLNLEQKPPESILKGALRIYSIALLEQQSVKHRILIHSFRVQPS